MRSAEKDFGSTIHNEKEKFKISLDVQHFKPNEINVKVADREVIIEGRHEERQDNHGFISRQFKRRYFLPHDCDADSVFSSLSSDGILTVSANKAKEIKNKETVIPIKMCETCPNNELKTNIEKKELRVSDDLKKKDTGAGKKNMEIMLKEDHCCLLRPEFLGALSGTEKMQNKKEATNLSVSANTSAATGQSKIATTEKTDRLSAGMSETMVSETATVGKTETCGMSSSGKSEKAETLLCGLSSAKTEKGETSGQAVEEKMGQTETVACGITSEILIAKAETSEAAKSEMSNIKSMFNETIQIQESSSSSYSSSMASSIKETTEKISEIVNDISAQLKEAAENI